MPNAILMTPSGAVALAFVDRRGHRHDRLSGGLVDTRLRPSSALCEPHRATIASSLWTKSDVISVVTALKPFDVGDEHLGDAERGELPLKEPVGGLADGKTPRRGHVAFEASIGRPTSPICAARCGAGACRVDDGRRSANELDLPRTLEQRLLGHELAAARDVAEPGVGAVGEEIRRGPHGDQHARRRGCRPRRSRHQRPCRAEAIWNAWPASARATAPVGDRDRRARGTACVEVIEESVMAARVMSGLFSLRPVAKFLQVKPFRSRARSRHRWRCAREPRHDCTQSARAHSCERSRRLRSEHRRSQMAAPVARAWHESHRSRRAGSGRSTRS